MSSLKTATWPFATLGLILSLYALYVEHKISHKPEEVEEGVEEFSALCDIESIGASCSSTFSLPEGKLVSYFGIIPEGHLLDVPNALLGAIFYTYWLVLGTKLPRFTFAISTTAMMTAVFLAYKLTVLHELCILCWSTHVITTRLMIRAYFQLGESSTNTKEPVLKDPPKIKRI